MKYYFFLPFNSPPEIPLFSPFKKVEIKRGSEGARVR